MFHFFKYLQYTFRLIKVTSNPRKILNEIKLFASSNQPDNESYKQT